MSTADDEVAKASCRLGWSCPKYRLLSMLGMDFRSSFPTASLFQGENELLKCFSPENPLEHLLAVDRNVFRCLDEQFHALAADWGCRDTNVVADENTVVRINCENQHFFLLDWAVFCTPGLHRSRAWRMIAMIALLANSSFLNFPTRSLAVAATSAYGIIEPWKWLPTMAASFRVTAMRRGLIASQPNRVQ